MRVVLVGIVCLPRGRRILAHLRSPYQAGVFIRVGQTPVCIQTGYHGLLRLPEIAPLPRNIRDVRVRKLAVRLAGTQHSNDGESRGTVIRKLVGLRGVEDALLSGWEELLGTSPLPRSSRTDESR